MAEEKEQELNEAELSDVKNSIAALAKKYITGSFFDKLADSSGIKIAKDILLDDLKNMIGHGTSGLAAKKFSNAIQMAKNPVAVDTILANYMLKGDGMGAGIGYSESEEIKPFKKFLSEAREEKKEVSQDLIAEARKIVEAEGFTVTDPEADKHVISKEKIEEAKKIVEARGYRVIEEKKIDEDIKLDMTLEIPAEEAGCDEEGLKDLIDDALAIGGMVDGIDDIEAKNGIVYVHFVSEEATPSSILYDLWYTVEDYIKTATGAEVEYGEDVVDFWERAFEKAEALL